MPWKKLLVWDTGQIDEALRQKLEFVFEETRVYRDPRSIGIRRIGISKMPNARRSTPGTSRATTSSSSPAPSAARCRSSSGLSSREFRTPRPPGVVTVEAVQTPTTTPRELRQVLALVRWLLILLFIVLGWVVLAYLAHVLAPILAALGIAYLLNPVVAWLGERGVSRAPASALVLVAFLAVIAVALALAAPAMRRPGLRVRARSAPLRAEREPVGARAVRPRDPRGLAAVPGEITRS